ncbi:endolytic transglycosylase MltG [Paludibacterium yongneupense]|uniref:endolytic transglycosylase MltG n=1 Tax=Paludibacterium yongneupense TaxID=400061 RepID=UPI00041179A3|nr:endolytic transglycosylase MltG [Paludibacterium yongneupense]
MMKSIGRILALAVVAAVAWLIWVVAVPVELPRTPYGITVGPNRTLGQVSRSLEDEGVIRNRRVMIVLARLGGYDRRLKAGLYRFNGPASLWDILQRFAQGRPDEASVTVIEGWTFRQLRAQLDQNPDLQHVTAGWSDAQILSEIGATETQAEGLFFPSTYYFNPESTDLALYQRAYRTMREHVDAAWQQRVAGDGLKSPYELLILASLIEKETSRDEDRPLVAAVFRNRLKSGMRLQTDPSVIYGMGEAYRGKIGKADLRRDTPYNTYTRSGLTPTPISLPGKASLQAAARPALSDVLYFVASGDGRSQFSATLQQHNSAVRKFILKKAN